MLIHLNQIAIKILCEVERKMLEPFFENFYFVQRNVATAIKGHTEILHSLVSLIVLMKELIWVGH